MFDVMIRNGRIADGTGTPWYRGDIGISDGKIQRIGNLSGFHGKEEYDAGDRYIAPGFIDIHTHSDKTIVGNSLAESRILQGVTTEIGGNCGMSVAPVEPAYFDQLKTYAAADTPYQWKTMGEFLQYVESVGISTNLGTLVGHGTLRIAVMGFSPDRPTEHQMEKMKVLAAQAVEEGAFGISSGLIYPPGTYADKQEITELVSVLGECGGYYATHMRNEGVHLIEAVTEALETAEKASVPLQISHHKCLYKPQWKKAVFQTTAMIEAARREGLDVTCDQYPYNASSTAISANIPKWVFEGGFTAFKDRIHDETMRTKIRDEMNESHIGRWQDIRIAYARSAANKWMQGKSVPEVAETLGKDPADLIMDLVEEEDNFVNEIDFGMCEEDIEYIMQKPYVMTGSDGEAYSLDIEAQPHPRSFGTFPRVIAHYSRDRKLFGLEEAVRKMTAMPAARAGLTDRGAIKQGMWADLVEFDLRSIESVPSYSDPKQPCSGIRRVFVNGVLTAENGKHLGKRSGKVLRSGFSGI